ncbi:MAG TPA: hypothetical protein VGN77_09280 [Steroidobacteraceae bacterium]|nr:hypothetical protein [Steroidobacteraceae bacterium]
MSSSGNQKSVLLSAMLMGALAGNIGAKAATNDYAGLLALFQDWRAFERPSLRAGAPDYTAPALARKATELAAYQARCAAIDPTHWPIAQQVDYQLVRAEMNGLDFDLRVLKPWARDPAFYHSLRTEQSDTPSHEGPNPYGLIELWSYAFPLSHADEQRLARELAIVPPLLAQAQGNLTGNAHDLWITGTGTMRLQLEELKTLAGKTKDSGAELRHAIMAASQATADFVTWLQAQAPSRNGPSGVGKENYTWSQQHVHLVPFTWDEEVRLLQRELARAHASLAFEEQRNRALPQLTAAATAAQYHARAEAAISKYMAFLKDQDLLTIQPYLDAAMRAHIGDFVPEAQRNFFQIASHIEPMTLFAHFYHWFDHAWMDRIPNASPVRRQALLSNIWDSRSEGMATAMEELILRAGYYEDNPRAREIVYIMLAQRCARGLASLYAQANEFDIAKAKAFQVEWTPRGWMRPDLDLLGFEQQLYLRQPGYGSSYVTGKDLIDDLIKERAHQLGKSFTVRGFFDELNGAGLIPVSMIHWQLTGQLDPALAALLRQAP